MTVNPRGLFDRSALGAKLESVSVQIERGRVRFFAEVLGETDAIHFDVDAARAAGHPDLVASPSFFVVVEAEANDLRKRLNQPSAAELVKSDYRYLLHGEQRYIYHAPLFAGETVQVDTTVTGFYDKKGGAMEFVTLESVISHATRGTLQRAQRTLLHRLPPV